jgi:hypothetical protein
VKNGKKHKLSQSGLLLKGNEEVEEEGEEGEEGEDDEDDDDEGGGDGGRGTDFGILEQEDLKTGFFKQSLMVGRESED